MSDTGTGDFDSEGRDGTVTGPTADAVFTEVLGGAAFASALDPAGDGGPPEDDVEVPPQQGHETD